MVSLGSHHNVLFCFVGIGNGVKLCITWSMHCFGSSSNMRWAQWGAWQALTDPIWCHDWVNAKLVSYQIKQKLQKVCGCEMDVASESRRTHKPGFWVQILNEHSWPKFINMQTCLGKIKPKQKESSSYRGIYRGLSYPTMNQLLFPAQSTCRRC